MEPNRRSTIILSHIYIYIISRKTLFASFFFATFSIKDTLAEWLRRRPAKPMESPCVGSNPTGVVLLCNQGLEPFLDLGCRRVRKGANPHRCQCVAFRA